MREKRTEQKAIQEKKIEY